MGDVVMNLRKINAIISMLIVVLLLTFVGPYAVLALARQEAVAPEYAYSESFCTDYEQTRAQLADRVAALREAGVTVETSEHAIDADDGLYIDNIYLPATEKNTNLIVLTTGVHGMEGYIGSVMLEVFFEEIYPELNREDTGVLVVANVNPYGMKNYRRYNENNVDLNRNFIIDWENFDLSSNKEYPKVDKFLGPEGKIGNALWHEAGFYLSLGKTAITDGAGTISDALLTGQYEYPQGVYYGGNGDEASTVYLNSFLKGYSVSSLIYTPSALSSDGTGIALITLSFGTIEVKSSSPCRTKPIDATEPAV